MTSNIKLSRRPQNFIRVNFTNRGLSKVVKSVRNMHEDTPNKEDIVDIGNILSDVKIEKQEPFGFSSSREFTGIDYVGYIIEKERLDKKTGNWVRIDEYRIIGSSANSFKDSRVAYGNQYRYRIKSIMKATIPIIKEGHENFDLEENLREFEKNRIKENIKATKSVLAGIDRITNNSIVGKSSTGFPLSTLNIIQGLQIQSDAIRTTPVRVSTTLEEDNISNLRIMKNLQSTSADFMRGTISQENLQRETNKALSGITEKFVSYKSFYYESDPGKKWLYVNVIDNKPPPPPSSISIIPNSIKREICVTWLKPANSQRDIKEFKVYRRKNIGVDWAVVSTLPENENIFTDENVIEGEEIGADSKWIYAITCVDAHGIESFLSSQVQAELNPNYKAEKEEKKLKWISGSGTRPDEVNVVLKKFWDQEKPIIARESINISPAKEFSDTVKHLIIKVTSLDTHEKKEFKVDLKNSNTGKTETEQ